MAEQVRGLSSMATRGLLADLSAVLRRDHSLSVHFTSAGGVEVAQDIRAGAQADLAVLSTEAMVNLDAEGYFETGTLRPLFVSEVVAAVPDDMEPVPFSTEQDLRAALLGARRIAYSTGPSGGALLELIQRWDLVHVVQHKLTQVQPGTPVGGLLANGEADLGFQQQSEFSNLGGVRVLGPLPGAAAIRSTFSGALLARSANLVLARTVLDFLQSKTAEQRILAAGMTIPENV